MENGMRRWLVDVSKWNPPEDLFSLFVSLLPQHERSAITRFLKFEDRKRALVSRLLQYSLVHEVLGIPFGQIIIDRTIEGKPYLRNSVQNPLFPNFNFNTSHHGDYVGIASEALCLVGLDIISNSVVIPPEENVLDFVMSFSSYFTILEWDNIMHAGDSDEILANFFRCWSLKEAFVKALGAGLGYGLDRLELRPADWTNVSVSIDGSETRYWRLCCSELDDQHWVSIARGPPWMAVESCRALSEADVEKARFLETLQLPDMAFEMRTVEELVPARLREGVLRS